MATPAEGSPATKTYPPAPMRTDPQGVVHLGRDGVLRSLDAARTTVLDYRRLSSAELKDFTAGASQSLQDALVGVDGRDVNDVEQLWAVPAGDVKPPPVAGI